jgi:hypothetical protein
MKRYEVDIVDIVDPLDQWCIILPILEIKIRRIFKCLIV